MMKDVTDQLEITELRLGQPGVGENGLPVCSYRRKSGVGDGRKVSDASKMYVKVSMDGVPFLRKIDLNSHSGYKELIKGFHKLFSCKSQIPTNQCAYHRIWIFVDTGEKMCINEEGDGSEYVPIYEDKDGDWMLVGDVPWQMFTESCKRLRIMKKSEAKGFEHTCRNTASTTGSSADAGR